MTKRIANEEDGSEGGKRNSRAERSGFRATKLAVSRRMIWDFDPVRENKRNRPKLLGARDERKARGGGIEVVVV